MFSPSLSRALRSVAVCAVASGCIASALPVVARASTAAAPAVHVAGNHLVDADGRPLRLTGVNRSGTEYACIQGWGIFDGPSDTASVLAIAGWHVNAVRIPLNEDCWLGINGVAPSLGGAAYQQAVQQYVSLLHSFGMVAILDLHWAAPGTVPATGQLPMADADHAPAFWAGVAAAFRGDPSVVFDLFNEPFLDQGNAVTSDPWSCWRDGCTVRPGGGVSTAWAAAGMQSLLNAVRGAGAGQPVMAGGLAWSNDLTGWLAHAPQDPAGQLVASLHMYNFNTCGPAACWDSQVAPVAAAVPVVTGELGENDCAGAFITQFMQWADQHGVSYLGWTWDTWDCRSGPALISDYTGTPTPFGAALRDHLSSIASGPMVLQPDPLSALRGASPATAAAPMNEPAAPAAAPQAAAAGGAATPNGWARLR